MLSELRQKSDELERLVTDAEPRTRYDCSQSLPSKYFALQSFCIMIVPACTNPTLHPYKPMFAGTNCRCMLTYPRQLGDLTEAIK